MKHCNIILIFVLIIVIINLSILLSALIYMIPINLLNINEKNKLYNEKNKLINNSNIYKLNKTNNNNNDNDLKSWNTHGFSIFNNRYVNDNKYLNSKTVKYLKERKFQAKGDISQTPSIIDDNYYFCDFSGYVWCVSTITNQLIWNIKLEEITNIKGDYCRSTSTSFKYLLVGSQVSGNLYQLNRYNGKLIKKILLDNNKHAKITMSPQIYNNSIYIGVSSNEEHEDNCCSFRGKFVKLNLDTLSIQWIYYSIPDKYLSLLKKRKLAGASIWGSTPSINEKSSLIYISTGNLYTTPLEWQECLKKNPQAKHCIPSDIHFDSVIALDMKTGKQIWTSRVTDNDIWVASCQFNSSIPCPNILVGPNADFGMSPIYVETKNIVICSQKSGVVYSFNANSGVIINAKKTSPGGILGGYNWGSASDNHYYYNSAVNYSHEKWKLMGNDRKKWKLMGNDRKKCKLMGNDRKKCKLIKNNDKKKKKKKKNNDKKNNDKKNNDKKKKNNNSNRKKCKRKITNIGFYSKMDITNFNVLCQIPIPFPNNKMLFNDNELSTNYLNAIGPPSLVNDLWIVTSVNQNYTQIHIFNKNNCKLLRSFSTDGNVVYGGVSIYKNCFYVGSGYGKYFKKGNGILYSYCI